MNTNEENGARIFCARGGYHWGLGFSKFQALDACAVEDGVKVEVVKLPPSARLPWVDMMGALRWTSDKQESEAELVGFFKATTDEEEDERDWEEVKP